MASTNDLKNGMVLRIEGQLWAVVEFQHVKPGKGPAFVRTKLRNVESGKNVDKTFNAGTKVETANVDKRTMQYLYNDGSSYVFMDTSTYEQLEVTPEVVGDAKNFMLENQEAIVATNEGRGVVVGRSLTGLDGAVERHHGVLRAELGGEQDVQRALAGLRTGSHVRVRP